MTPVHPWFLTWRTYGTWLPGDERGFVGPAVDHRGRRVIANVPGDPMHAGSSPLQEYARGVMKGAPVRLKPGHAVDLLAQLRETAAYRGWQLLAAAVLSTHVHLVVRVEGDPEGESILRDFKSYAARKLNRTWGVPPNGSWWSESGSRRVLRGEGNVREAVDYVAGQPGAFLIWVNHAAGDPSADSTPGERPA